MKTARGSGLAILLGLLAGNDARAQDATLTVYLRAAGAGTFGNNNGGLTQARVQTTSAVAAQWNGPTNVYAPTASAALGTAFSVTVPSLYSGARVPNNLYTLSLLYTDTTLKSVSLGSLGPLPVGPSSYGAGGLGSTQPIDVVNDPPPAATTLGCSPDLPDRTTSLYFSWSYPSARPADFKEQQLHLSQTAGFTPSAATRLLSVPYGSTSRSVTGLLPGRSYYFCVRIVDNYDATTDTCRPQACATAPPADMGSADLASPSDLGTASDLGGADLGAATGGADGGAGADLAGSGAGGGEDLSASTGGEDLSASTGGDDLGTFTGGGAKTGCSVAPGAAGGAGAAGPIGLLVALSLWRRRRPTRQGSPTP